jgi:hypothetical protein
MSESYEHLLVPVSPEYRPDPDRVASFLQGIVRGGHIADDWRISFAKVVKNDAPGRQIHNAMTNETIQLPARSRKIERPITATSFSEFLALADGEAEYDVMVAAEGLPRHPPCDVGYIDGKSWRVIDRPHALEICCRVRRRVVRLYSLESPDDLRRPLDFSKVQFRFDEDCDAKEERDGLFVHPEAGPLCISHAGSGTFWIEFRYGKWLFPRLTGNPTEIKETGIRILNQSTIDLAQKAFETDFVEACNWA